MKWDPMTGKIELENLLSEAETVAKDPSPDGIKKLLDEITKSLGINDLQLAQALDVSPASVGRWKNGKMPQAKQLRAIQEWLALKISQLSESGLDFKGRKVGIYSIDTFFQRAEGAKAVYV